MTKPKNASTAMSPRKLVDTLVGREFILHLDPNANVSTVDGLMEAVADITRLVPREQASYSTAILNSVRVQVFGLPDRSFDYGIPWLLLPPRFVSEGDSWTTGSEEPPCPDCAPLKKKSVFTITNREKGLMTINSKLSEFSKSDVTARNTVDVRNWTNGSGLLKLDEVTGWTTYNHVTRRYKMQRVSELKRKQRMDVIEGTADFSYECLPLETVPIEASVARDSSAP